MNGFNGAMTFQSWKGPAGTIQIPTGMESFNGAMTFQSWKGSNAQAWTLARGVLQWGHDFSVMESRRLPPGPPTTGLASMGP